MNEVLTELSKPAWWFSVVIAGVVINLFAAYLKGTLDSSLSKASAWWRKRSETRIAKFQSLVDRIRENDETRKEVVLNEFRMRLQSLHLVLMAILMMLLILPLSLSPSGTSTSGFFVGLVSAGSTVTFFLSIRVFLAAANIADALRKAKKLTDS